MASHVKALAFSFMGSSILAHKICALGWGLLVVGASVRLLHRHGGGERKSDSAAALGGVLLALGPAHFQRASLLHLGIHFEALLFVALVLDQGLRVSRSVRGEAPRRRDLLVLGLAAGFGTYFSYQVALAVVVVAGLLAVRAPRLLLSPVLIGSTILGLAPLILMALAVGGEVLDLHGESIGGTGPGFLASLRAGLGAARARGGAAWSRRGDRWCCGFATGQGPASRGADAPRVRRVVVRGGGSDRALRLPVRGRTLVRSAPCGAAGMGHADAGRALAGPALALEELSRGGPAAKVARSTTAALLGIGLIHAARIVDQGEPGRAGENLRHLARLRGDDPRGALVKLGPRLEDGRSTLDGTVEAEVVGRFLTADSAPGLITDVVAAVTQATEARAEDLEAQLAPLLADTPGGLEAARRGLGSPLFHHRFPGRLRKALESEAVGAIDAEAMGRFGLGWYGATDLSAEIGAARAPARPALPERRRSTRLPDGRDAALLGSRAGAPARRGPSRRDRAFSSPVGGGERRPPERIRRRGAGLRRRRSRLAASRL